MALYNALNNEVIMAAGLDVMVEEPPKPPITSCSPLKNAIFQPAHAPPARPGTTTGSAGATAFQSNCMSASPAGQKAFWIVPELR